jgi:hypothetical protein
MAYIPGPGIKEKKTPIQPTDRESEAIPEKPLKRYYEEHYRQKKRPKKEARKETEQPRIKKPILKPEKETQGFRPKSSFGFLWFFLFLVTLVFSIFNYMKLHEFKNYYTSQVDALKIKSEEQYKTLNKMILDDRAYLGPNGIIDKYLVVSNNIDSQIIGIQDIIALSESRSFDKVGFMRFFISGSKPVWVSIKSSTGKIVFQDTLSPGLSQEMIYYFKKPTQAIQDITIEVTQNFEVNTGNFESTYLVFFSFGVTKIVRMDSKTISNPVQKYNIWLPGTT